MEFAILFPALRTQLLRALLRHKRLWRHAFIGEKSSYYLQSIASVAFHKMKQADRNDIEKLSRGLATKAKIGNRSIGHRLTQKERILFEAAKRQGHLKIPYSGVRQNVLRIYRLWCEVEGHDCIIVEAGQ